MMEGGVVDDRFEILEVWRRPLRGDASAAVRVLAKVEAGAYGPEEYAVGISTRADAQLSPLLDEADLFTGLSFAEAHWVAAVLASAADRVEDAESLLFDLRVPVDLAWREVELASEVVEPGGLRSAPLVPWEPEGGTGPSRYAIATYTLDCGHQAVELLRQDPDAAPFWVEDGSGGPPGRPRRAQPDAAALRRRQPRGRPRDHRGGAGEPRPPPGRRRRRRGPRPGLRGGDGRGPPL